MSETTTTTSAPETGTDPGARIRTAFAHGPAFIGFITAGDPTLADTERFIPALLESGCDLVEIGIPFSDPIAEGPVIQGADVRALQAGATTDRVFDMVGRLRPTTGAPLVFMTYYNVVFGYGQERFFARCEDVGIDGIIIPDLPYEEQDEARPVANAHGVALISMVAPTSEPERLTRIAADSQGFLYVVSSLGVTGERSRIATDLAPILDRVHAATDTPAAIGFGISTPEQAARIAKIADGAIVGSAIVRIVAEHGAEAEGPLREYVAAMKAAVRPAR